MEDKEDLTPMTDEKYSMINLTELARSSASARQARLAYEDLVLVAHLSELERVDQTHGRQQGHLLHFLRKALLSLTMSRPFPPCAKGATRDHCCG